MNIRCKNGITSGLKRGLSGYIWLLKILTPISFGTALLVYSGWLYKIDFIIQPVMGVLSLPASAALPLIIGIFTGIYGAIGAMAALPLTVEQMTLIAIFLLISHNLIQESIVQGQSGLNPFIAAGFRLAVSFIVTAIAAFFIEPQTTLSAASSVAGSNATEALYKSIPFLTMFKGWFIDFATLALKIFTIIMPLMVVMELMKAFDLIRHIVKTISPILSIMGLSRATGVLWLTAACFGLAYGAAVIVDETRNNNFSRDELIRLHLSIGINHAVIEDPALFLPLGISPFWLWIPRLLAAIFTIYVIHIINLVRKLYADRKTYAKRTCHKKFCDH
ncbi:MAG: iron transporter [Desulfamplus sp.]|nr:iron transporter [Desulfamplus sp.]